MPTARLIDIVHQPSNLDEPHSYSSTQVNLPEEFAEKIRAFAAKIPDDALADDGREDKPHITLKYGLHDEDPKPVQKLLQGVGSITAKVKGVSIFPAKESSAQRGPQYDVVKVDIESPDLRRLNKKVSELPHTDTHPTYQPHITIAYVKPGEGKKYVGRPVPGLSGKTLTFGSVKFSPAEGDKTDIPLNGTSSNLDEQKEGVRRVTGSADIPLNADGKKQSKQLAQQKAMKPFDKVFSSPEKRALQTAKEFGEPIILSGLDAWKRAMFEGKPVDSVKEAIRNLMLNPDKRPPGKSPISGEPGESLNECARPLLATIQALEAIRPKGARWLAVSHGGDLQIADAWAKAGKPDDLSFDYKKMAAVPYWSVTSKLFVMADKGLVEVENDDDEGMFYLEHSETAFNPKGVQDSGKPGTPAPAQSSGERATAAPEGTGKKR